jgi:hypothetical protein
MELCSIQPFDLTTVHQFVAVLHGDESPPAGWAGPWLDAARRQLPAMQEGNEEAACAVGYALGVALSLEQPVYAAPRFGLTVWEAQIDRGIGMLMRPPSRLLVDAGLATRAARTLPIRLELSRGMMGGAFVPARLVPDLATLLAKHETRIARRLAAAEYDAVEMLGLLLEAVGYAHERELGLFEAMDVVAPDLHPVVQGATVIGPDKKRMPKELRARITEAAKPPKQPGLLARLFGRTPANLPGGGTVAKGYVTDIDEALGRGRGQPDREG